ncbi:hypothetical protein AB6D77_08065 [Vibrio splendidus]
METKEKKNGVAIFIGAAMTFCMWSITMVICIFFNIAVFHDLNASWFGEAFATIGSAVGVIVAIMYPFYKTFKYTEAQ